MKEDFNSARVCEDRKAGVSECVGVGESEREKGEGGGFSTPQRTTPYCSNLKGYRPACDPFNLPLSRPARTFLSPPPAEHRG